MNITLYKYYKRDKYDTGADGFEYTEVLTENQLREKFIEEYKNFHKDNLAQYEVLNNLDMSKEDDKWIVFDNDISFILDIFSDNDEYDENNDYFIEQIEVGFNEYEDCYD